MRQIQVDFVAITESWLRAGINNDLIDNRKDTVSKRGGGVFAFHIHYHVEEPQDTKIQTLNVYGCGYDRTIYHVLFAVFFLAFSITRLTRLQKTVN